MALVKRRNKNEVSSALWEWIKWTPLLAVFGVIAFDATLSVGGRAMYYEYGKLDTQRRQLNDDLNKARAEEAQWNDIRRVAEIIARLKMSLPDPRQIQVVVAHPETPMPVQPEAPRDGNLEMAGRSAAPVGAGPAQAVPTARAVVLPVMAAATLPAPAVDAARPAAPPAASIPVAPPPAAPASVLPAPPSATVPAPAVTVASRPAPPTAMTPKVLDLPKEQIEDLDSPDAPSNDPLAHL